MGFATWFFEGLRSVAASSCRRSGTVLAALGAALLGAQGAQALTFTNSASFAYSGSVTPVGQFSLVRDLADGFALRGDYQVGIGTSFLIGRRSFSIGPLPERIDTAAREHFKLVVAGGNSGAPTAARLEATVNYTIEPEPLGAIWPTPARTNTVAVTDNGYVVHDAGVVGPVDPVLPTQRILSPGNYQLKTFIGLHFVPGEATAFPVNAFIELGGLTGFEGLELHVVGVPMPEPASAVMLVAGIAALGWRLRARARS